jgi:hypothetical protein
MHEPSDKENVFYFFEGERTLTGKMARSEKERERTMTNTSTRSAIVGGAMQFRPLLQRQDARPKHM